MPKVVLLLVLWALLGDLPATEGRTSPYAVKLCGREFIRAVIFTCGGSRWRRARAGESHGPYNALLFSPGDAFAEELGGESQETTSIEWLSKSEPEARSGQGFLRGGRDVLAGVSSNCCKWGCSKTEISSLC
uniref:Relaxin-3 n=1 Tax=Vombatus ursinus TaxID=29139 RepID=A0A4X2MB43_VOMUR